jgi:hypothetical protein
MFDELQVLRRNGVIRELANVYGMGSEAQALLESIGFPRGQLPAGADSAEGFWGVAAHHIDAGLVEGGLLSLLDAARENYRYNSTFAQWAEELRRRRAAPGAPAADPAPPAAVESLEPPQSGAEPRLSLIVTGYGDDVYGTIDRVRGLARESGLGAAVEIGWANQESIQFRLNGASQDQVLALGRALESSGNGLRTTFSRVPFEDFLLHRLLVEGPDQAHFELSNVPASTTVKDIARAIVTEYQDSAWPRDPNGQARPAVIDHVSPEGAAQRLEPRDTLHESGVRDGDTLHMAPESTAGGVNPQFREEHLARARAQVVSYAAAHPGFEVLANATVAPTEYLFRFQENGWAPPPGKGESPIPVNEHEVLLVLPADFPVLAPVAFWQTLIFHPNVDAKTGKVCLGVLEDRYRPGLDFGELCQLLVDIAGYRNFETREGYNLEAQQWALSAAGQRAIESRGGRSEMRKALGMLEDFLVAPLPIQIRRRDT